MNSLIKLSPRRNPRKSTNKQTNIHFFAPFSCTIPLPSFLPSSSFLETKPPFDRSAMADLYGTSPSSDVVALPHDPQDFSSSSSFINPNKFVPFLHSQPPWHSPSLAGASCTLDFPDDRRAFTHALPDSRFADFLKQGSDSVFSSSGAGGGDSDANAPWKRRDLSSDNDLADFSCDSEGGDVPELPSSTDLSRNSSKRSRSAEVHNMSEKRRRRRINEKMKALQNLIPNSNKTDKASMLDEAIEYLKQLQVQVQMLSMRNGLSLQPMCLPGMMQPIQLPHMGLDFDVGNAFLASRRGIDASSTGNEGCPMQSIFSLSNKCNLSDQSIAIPSVPNTTTPETTFGFEPAIQAYNGQFDLSSDFKDVQPATQIDCARTGKDSADVS